MELIQNIVTKNPCYTAGREMEVKGIMLHSTDSPGSKAIRHIRRINRVSEESFCIHAFIDGETGNVIQTLPWNYRGWHAGLGENGTANDTHIGVNICVPDAIQFLTTDEDSVKESVKLTYASAVELCASLCKQFNLDPLEDGVLISHKEGALRGIALQDEDPEQLWTMSGLNYIMKNFRQDVAAKMQVEEPEIDPMAEEDEEEEEVVKITPTPTSWRVRVTVPALRVRSGPGARYKENGIIRDKGIYTIIAKENGWGKLESDKFIGWIMLEYTRELK